MSNFGNPKLSDMFNRPVSERRDDQPSRIADILVCVIELGISLSNYTVIFTRIPKELQLGKPVKRCHINATLKNS